MSLQYKEIKLPKTAQHPALTDEVVQDMINVHYNHMETFHILGQTKEAQVHAFHIAALEELLQLRKDISKRINKLRTKK